MTPWLCLYILKAEIFSNKFTGRKEGIPPQHQTYWLSIIIMNFFIFWRGECNLGQGLSDPPCMGKPCCSCRGKTVVLIMPCHLFCEGRVWWFLNSRKSGSQTYLNNPDLFPFFTLSLVFLAASCCYLFCNLNVSFSVLFSLFGIPP